MYVKFDDEEYNFCESEMDEQIGQGVHFMQSQRQLTPSTPGFKQKLIDITDCNHNMTQYSHNSSRTELKSIVQHMIDYKQKKQKKIQQIQLEMENKLMQECTFKPQTNHNANHRSLNQFLHSQQKHLEKVSAKNATMKRQLEQNHRNNEIFKPQINQKNNKSHGKQIPTYERLYLLRERDKNKNHIQQQHVFQPKIQKRSVNLHRGQPVQQLLYDDALKRSNKQKQTLIIEDKQNTKSQLNNNPNNHRYVAQKFIKEYYKNMQKLERGDLKQHYQVHAFSQILYYMGFLRCPLELEGDLQTQEHNLVYLGFQLLSEYGVTARNICVFLMALIGIYNVNPINFPNSQDSTLFMPDQTQGRKLQKNFQLLFTNRLSCDISTIEYNDPNSYIPQINQESNQMAQKHRMRMIERVNKIIQQKNIGLSLSQNGIISHEELLVIDNIGRDLQLKKKKIEKDKQEDPECTFTPKTINNNKGNKHHTGIQKSNQLYEVAKIKQQIQKRKYFQEKEIRNEKPMRNKKISKGVEFICKTPKVQIKSYNQIKDLDKAVARMYEGRKIKQKKEYFLNRGENKPKNNCSKPQSNPCVKHQQVTSPKIDDRKTCRVGKQCQDSNKIQPLLVLDMDLGSSIQSLNFYPGDEQRWETIVSDFCKLHKLQVQTLKILTGMIREQIQNGEKNHH